MKERVFIVLLTLFSAFGSPAFSEDRQYSELQDLQCKQVEDSVYELNWKGNEEDQVYHLFASEDWEELMPLEPAHLFITSAQANKCLLSTSSQKCLSLTYKPSYLRLVAENGEELVDFARLVKLESEEEILPIGKNLSKYSSQITEDVWRQVHPYLLPENNHGIKNFLDKICSEIRVLSSKENLERAGFKIIFQQANRGLVVAKHPKLPGYLLKMYLDSCPRTEWPLWVLRAKGARIIQELLNKHYYNCFMKVPQKWIYPVPSFDRPVANENTFPKDFILIVQDMRLVTDKYNLYCYKNNMTFARLDALYTMIDEGGLSDSHIKNIPFSADQKIAFIDTEYVNSWPVHFDWLTKNFSPTHQSYWLKLMRERETKK